MSDQRKNIMIGIFVVVAIAIVIWIILFLRPTVGDGKKTFYVRFSNIAGINDGTRVTFAGKPVGEVVSIEQVPNAREQPIDQLGRVYFYQLKLKVDSSVKIYTTDVVSTETSGLLGEKAIAIIPKAPRKGQTPKLITNQVIYAQSVDSFQTALHDFSELTNRIEGLVSNVDEWFSENSNNLGDAVASFAGAMHELDTTLDAINEENLMGATKGMIDSITTNMGLLRTTLEDVQDNQIIMSMGDLIRNLDQAAQIFNIDGRQILSNLNVITGEIADGQGSLGQLISSDDLYLRILNITSKIDTLMNDINHYGVLFQYDKHWQRTRTKRANIMASLSSPKDFRDYFEEEVDSINTALSRISMMIEKADQQDEKIRIMNSECFKKDFADLYKRVEALSDSLKLYNEQLMQSSCD